MAFSEISIPVILILGKIFFISYSKKPFPQPTSKILLPVDINDDLNSAQEMSELLELQLRRLEAIQKVSKLLFKSHQLGVHFFKRGNPEFFKNNQKVRYNLSLFDLIKSYGKIISNDNSKSITIAKSKLYVVEEAVKNLRNLIIL